MKAIAVTPSKKEIGIIDQPEPKISSPNDVKLRMIEAGVCGTDKEICAFEYGTPPGGSEQLVIGHESLGEVVEVGPKVTRVRSEERRVGKECRCRWWQEQSKKI